MAQRRLFPDPFWNSFWLFLGPPGTVKIVLPSRRGATFYKNRRTRSGAQNRPQNDPKMSSNWVQNGPLAAPGGLKVSSKAVLDFSPKPKSFLDDFQASKGPLNGAQNRSKTGLGAQRPPRGRPRPAQRPPGHLLEAILTKFRTPRGVIFEPPGIDFWAPRGSNCHAVLPPRSWALGRGLRLQLLALGL